MMNTLIVIPALFTLLAGGFWLWVARKQVIVAKLLLEPDSLS